MTKKKIRVLLIPVREYRQLCLAFDEDDAIDRADHFNELEADKPIGLFAFADVHNLCTTPFQNKGLRRSPSKAARKKAPRKQA